MLRFKILQMRVQHPKEKIDIVGRLRNFESALVSLLVRKTDPQGDFFGDEIDRSQPQRELLQKPAQHEKQRLGSLNLVFEFKALIKRLRRLNKFQEARRCSIGPFPKPDGIGAEPVSKFLFIQGSKLPQGVNPP